jgi:hypothetical protein
MDAPKNVSGHINVVQEARFRLITDDGAGLLLTLGQHAGASPEDLHRYQRDNVRVVVDYVGEPNLVSGVALRVVNCDFGIAERP